LIFEAGTTETVIPVPITENIMKKLFCIFFLLVLNLPVTFAHDPFSYQPKTHVSPLLVGGIVIGGIGVMGLGLGSMIYALSAGLPSQNNTAIPVMAVGGALAVGGVIMICAGASKMRGKRLSLVAPKPNQLGLAYNLSKR
jgi:hypothetical protein